MMSTSLSEVPVGTPIRIGYRDANNLETERTITVQYLYKSSDGLDYARAWCELRGQERTFRLDRIAWTHEPAHAPVARATTRPVRLLGPSWRPARASLLWPASMPPSAPKTYPRTVASGKPTGRISPFDIVGGVILAFLAGCMVLGFAMEVGIADLGPRNLRRSVPATSAVPGSRPPSLVPAPAAVVPLQPPTGPAVIRPAPTVAVPAPAALRPSVTETARTSVPARPEPSPRIVQVYHHRGVRIEATEMHPGAKPQFRAVAVGTAHSTLQGARVAINVALTAERTGIEATSLAVMYAAADQNENGTLDWGEIERFQTQLMESKRYQHNDTALRPDHFWSAGGGDCEDFALFTCGLLAFWGYECVIGSFRGPSEHIGHAVALVPTTNPPSRFVTATLPDGRTAVPIDYHVVGGFSNATHPNATLRTVWEPTTLYGVVM